MKGDGTTSFQLDSGVPPHLSDVLYILVMKRNYVFISTLDDKGYKISLYDGEVLAWNNNSRMY